MGMRGHSEEEILRVLREAELPMPLYKLRTCLHCRGMVPVGEEIPSSRALIQSGYAAIILWGSSTNFFAAPRSKSL
jgi:hypothetical protein